MKKFSRAELAAAYWGVPWVEGCGGDYGLHRVPYLLREAPPGFRWHLDAPYQRGDVWAEQQQADFMGAFLSGGMVPPGPPIILNIPGHGGVGVNGDPTFVVDGKQRLTAMDRFLRGEIPAAIGGEIGDVYVAQTTPSAYMIRTVVVDFTLSHQARFYLKLNAGVPHSSADLEHARKFL